MSLRLLARQGASYVVVGLLALGVDWSCFVALTWCGLATALANFLARLSGAGIAYLLNGMYTFRDGGGSRLGWRRFLKFAIAWGVVTVISTLAMLAIEHKLGLNWAWLAKPIVEVALAGVSFLAYRHWIYK
jgi:putative flippase GtrA